MTSAAVHLHPYCKPKPAYKKLKTLYSEMASLLSCVLDLFGEIWKVLRWSRLNIMSLRSCDQSWNAHIWQVGDSHVLGGCASGVLKP